LPWSCCAVSLPPSDCCSHNCSVHIDNPWLPIARFAGSEYSKHSIMLEGDVPKIAGREDVLFHTPTPPRLGIVIALAFHGKMGIGGRLGVGSAGAPVPCDGQACAHDLPRGLELLGHLWAVRGVARRWCCGRLATR
jgi:hypothetical protein